MFGKIRLRFEQQVAMAFSVLCFAVIAASVLGSLWINADYEIDRIKRHSSRLAAQVSTELDLVMFERFREVELLADLKLKGWAWQSEPARIRETIESFKASLPTYAWIGLASSDGIVRAATQGMLEGRSVKERSWFAAGLKGPAVSDVHDAVLLSALLSPSQAGKPARFVDVSMPVYGEGHALMGVLGAHLKWEWIEGVQRRFLSDEPAASDLWILSADGKVLLGPRLGERPFGPSRLEDIKSAGRGTFIDQVGPEAILTGFAATGGLQTYKGLGWIVILRTPTSVAYEPVYRNVRTMLLFSSIVAVVGILLAWVVARRSAAPILRLTDAVHHIGRDPTITMLPWLGGAREFVELSLSLRSLLRRIGVAENELTKAEERHSDDTGRLRSTIEKLRGEADHDSLTGLLNRRALLVFADDALAYFRRYRRTFAMMMVDVDHFKSVNDRLGHSAGDDVLRRLADVLQSSVRKTDKVARFGGEEFVLLLREIEQEDVLVFAERLRAAVAKLEIASGGKPISVTVSIGAALISNSESDIQALIERADKALYEAKRSGRNCVMMDDAPRIRALRALA